MNEQKSPDRPAAETPETAKKPGRPDKAGQLNEHIGKELRAMFDDVVAEPVPDRFRQLLDALEQKQAKD
jgi:Anti-sigma factor NepR